MCWFPVHERSTFYSKYCIFQKKKVPLNVLKEICTVIFFKLFKMIIGII